ncbi:MAG: BCAM0308 family protein [Desulfuromonas sp.]|jgi:NMD protein affecting ribosome stability and mRNA decay|nr:BCAM0308 family protein [Desulfuromonas thiophila]MDD3801277.1 BCAM0308 family protein [Desulfuromonas thiophila]
MNRDVGKFGINDKRGRVQTSNDSYANQQTYADGAFCSGCHAQYRNKRWYLDEEAFAQAQQQDNAPLVLCPACLKMRDGYYEGVVVLQGDYLWQHEEEICRLLKNEEARARAKNPLERMLCLEKRGETLVVETTEEKLAEHLGRALHSAHQGELLVQRGEDNRICRVSWQR